MLTQSEYRVLCALQDNENACAEDIAHELGMEPRAITRALAALTRAGYLRDNATLTDVGKMAFQPYQICDAMYHAQGFYGLNKPEGRIRVTCSYAAMP